MSTELGELGGVGSLGLVERGLERSCRRGGGKGTSTLKGVKGQFRVGDEETVSGTSEGA